MPETLKHEGILLDYIYEGDLFYKDKYSNKLSDIAYVDLYHLNKFVSMAYVWCDNEMNGREYIEINHTVVYLDTIRTLVSVNDLIENMCNQYEITIEELKGKGRKRSLSEPRNILYYILRVEYGLKYQAIADMFDRTHATILSGKNNVKGFMEVSDKYADKIKALILTEFRKQEELELDEL